MFNFGIKYAFRNPSQHREWTVIFDGPDGGTLITYCEICGARL